jgi:hypothetical protein
VAETGLERADGEQLTVAIFLAERFDLWTLHDQHGLLPQNLIACVRDVMREEVLRGRRGVAGYFE